MKATRRSSWSSIKHSGQSFSSGVRNELSQLSLSFHERNNYYSSRGDQWGNYRNRNHNIIPEINTLRDYALSCIRWGTTMSRPEDCVNKQNWSWVVASWNKTHLLYKILQVKWWKWVNDLISTSPKNYCKITWNDNKGVHTCKWCCWRVALWLPRLNPTSVHFVPTCELLFFFLYHRFAVLHIS